jgi:hypothetical protein
VSITKVYRLLQLAPDDRRRLVDRRVRIPDTDLRLRLEEMTMAHLDRVIRDMITPPPAEDPVPELLRAARHRLAGFEAQAAELIEHRADVDPADIAALHTQLVDVTHRLERAFRL